MREMAAARLHARSRIKESTRKEYEARAKRIEAAGGKIDATGMGKRELALWKAAAKWKAKERILEAVAEGERILRSDVFEREADRWKAFAGAVKRLKIAEWKLKETEFALAELKAEPKADEMKRERSHKKRPFRKGEAEKFFKAVGGSEFREAFLVALFCGARPAEFEGGISVRRVEHPVGSGKAALMFDIRERAKQGKGKGQKSGRILLPEADVGPEYGRLFRELMKRGEVEGEFVVQVEPSPGMSPGRRLTVAANNFGRKFEGERPSFYSFRQTFSSMVKAGEAARFPTDPAMAAQKVAEALGHQSTETARHYGRAARGGDGFAPQSRIRKAEAVPVRDYGASRGPEGRAAHRRTKEARSIGQGMRPGTAPPKPKGI